MKKIKKEEIRRKRKNKKTEVRRSKHNSMWGTFWS